VNRDQTINLDELHITAHELGQLDAPFSEDEVRRTIRQLPSNKAPRPDGFIGQFYQTCWSIIKQDIMNPVSAIGSRKFRNLETLRACLEQRNAKQRNGKKTQKQGRVKGGKLQYFKTQE